MREKIDDEEEQVPLLLPKKDKAYDKVKQLRRQNRRNICKIIGIWILIGLVIVSLFIGLQIRELWKISGSKFELLELNFGNSTLCERNIRTRATISVYK
jgi:hypothetical protein